MRNVHLTKLTALFVGSKMFYAHAVNSEHAQYAIWFYENVYWLEWTEYAHWGMFFVHAIVIINFKVRGVT